MNKAVISDVSWVILFPKDKSYKGSLNELNKSLMINSNYNALEHFEINKELLKFYERLETDLYIFTSDIIQDRPEFAENLKIFKNVYSASKLGLSKKQENSYTELSRLVGLNPAQIIYIDDSQENITAAQKSGLDVIKYESNEQIITELKRKFFVSD